MVERRPGCSTDIVLRFSGPMLLLLWYDFFVELITVLLHVLQQGYAKPKDSDMILGDVRFISTTKNRTLIGPGMSAATPAAPLCLASEGGCRRRHSRTSENLILKPGLLGRA